MNDEQVRGRIKAIDLMLQLPVELQQEAIGLKQADLAQNAPQQD